MKILFLACNPQTSARLNIDEEARVIERSLRVTRLRDSFDLVTAWAVRAQDLPELLMRHQPDIVHFSGHGGTEHGSAGRRCDSGIVLLDRDGAERTIRGRVLANLFRALKKNIRIVILNACNSEAQASLIGAHIDVAIGMRGSIHDRSARWFAEGFYSALGFGEDVATAFQIGKSVIALSGTDHEHVPRLKSAGVDPSALVMAQPASEQ